MFAFCYRYVYYIVKDTDNKYSLWKVDVASGDIERIHTSLLLLPTDLEFDRVKNR